MLIISNSTGMIQDIVRGDFKVMKKIIIVLILLLTASCEKSVNETSEERKVKSSGEQLNSKSYREAVELNENYKKERKSPVKTSESPSDQEYQKIALSVQGKLEVIENPE